MQESGNGKGDWTCAQQALTPQESKANCKGPRYGRGYAREDLGDLLQPVLQCKYYQEQQ